MFETKIGPEFRNFICLEIFRFNFSVELFGESLKGIVNALCVD